MILGIIVALIFIAYGIYEWIYWSDWEQGVPYIIISVVAGGFITLMSQLCWTAAAPMEEFKVKETKIYTLQTSTSVEGSFCLGNGYISGDARYFVYIKDEKGRYKLLDVDTDDTTLLLTDFESPKLITYEIRAVGNNWFFGFGEPWNIFNTYEYEIVCPINTIQVNTFDGMVK